MKEFKLPLVEMDGCYLPLINYKEITVLIDTGATIPVFSIRPLISSNELKVDLIMTNQSIFGFGGEAKGDVYCLKDFKIGSMIFKNLDVFVPNKSILENVPIILSASMFYGTYFAFDTINGNFIVKLQDNQSFERNFKIKNINGELYPTINGVMLQTLNYNFQSLMLYDKNGNFLNRDKDKNCINKDIENKNFESAYLKYQFKNSPISFMKEVVKEYGTDGEILKKAVEAVTDCKGEMPNFAGKLMQDTLNTDEYKKAFEAEQGKTTEQENIK